MKYDVIRLVGHNSLIMPNAPNAITLEQVHKKAEMEAKDIESFGLFDTATPNFSNYYPDVKAEDLNPELDKASFIYPVFRALSEVIVHKKFNPIDFGVNNVLKNSMGLLKSQTVYPNHEMAIGNELGVIFEEKWQKSYVTKNGITVPAGINVRLKLDGKSNPKIIRGIMMDPPSIHSTSVTVEFGWEKSHSSMDDNEFWGKLGTYGADGQQVRRIATEIKRFHEISLVPHGADPFAQMIKPDGEINNPLYSDKTYNSEKIDNSRRVYSFSYKENLTSLSEKPEPEENNSHKNMEYLLKLAQQMGITTEGKDQVALEAEVSAKTTALLSAKAEAEGKVISLTTEKQTLNAAKIEAEKFKADNESFVEAGKTALTALRDSIKATLGILKEGKVDASLITLVDNSSFAQLNALKVDYEAQLEAKAPLHCEACNSTNVSRRTSTPEPEGNTGNNPTPAKTKSFAEAAKEIEASKKGGLFFTEKESN